MMAFGPKPPGTKYGQPVAPNLNVRHICPNCRSDPPNIIEEYSKGDLVCGDCGTILGDRVVDTRSEWRTFASDEAGQDPSRVGQAGNGLIANDLDTQVSGLDGRSGQSSLLARAQARANIATSGPGRTTNTALVTMFGKIAQKCETMHLPQNIVQRAQHVYKIADAARAIRGKNDRAVVAACIIFACRDAGSDRTFAEVCRACQVSKKELNQVFTPVRAAVQAERNKKGVVSGNFGVAQTTQSVEALLTRYTHFLDLGNATANASKHVAHEAQRKAKVDGRSPVSIAAGVLWFTCILLGTKIKLDDLIKVAEVSSSTTKLIARIISDVLDDVIRPEWKTQYANGYAQLAALTKSGKGDSPKESRAATPAGKDDDVISVVGEPELPTSQAPIIV